MEQLTKYQAAFIKIKDMCTDYELTDDEVTEIMKTTDMLEYLFDDYHYEYAGNFILTANESKRDDAVEKMCCGIIQKTFTLSSGKKLYFAFDYGH